MTEFFQDASYAIALSASSDQFHQRAVLLAEQVQSAATRLVTTRAVALEIGNALAKQRYHSAAVVLLSALDHDRAVEVVPLSEALFQQAFELYRQRPDKEWGLTDCVSFVLMKERGITEALTTDDHFRQAGFRALLKEDEVSGGQP
jgi:hypothetical protein